MTYWYRHTVLFECIIRNWGAHVQERWKRTLKVRAAQGSLSVSLPASDDPGRGDSLDDLKRCTSFLPSAGHAAEAIVVLFLV